jgi:hypothetical protein
LVDRLSSARLQVNLLDRSPECTTEHPELAIALDLAEGVLRFQESGRRPAQRHLGVASS